MASPNDGAAGGPKPRATEEKEKPRARGLSSVQQAREARSSGKQRYPSGKFWAYGGLVLTIALIFHWKSSQGENDRDRQKLMAKQRAVSVELGPRWFPLRDKLEGWTTGLAKEAGQELVDGEALAKWDFREK